MTKRRIFFTTLGLSFRSACTVVLTPRRNRYGSHSLMYCPFRRDLILSGLDDFVLRFDVAAAYGLVGIRHRVGVLRRESEWLGLILRLSVP